MSADAPSGTQAARRAIAVLRTLAESAEELPVSRIAERLELSSGTANRLVKALVAEGLVARNPQTDGYVLGTATILLGQAAQRQFGLDRALPVLERVRDETLESVNLSTRDGSESVVVLRAQSELALRFEQHPGARFPAYSTASGKAVLAWSPGVEEYLRELPEDLPPLTPRTVPSVTALREELALTRERGYAVDDEENVEGVRCIGAPVRDARGAAHAAVVIQVPSVRLPLSRQAELAVAATHAADEVSKMFPVDRVLTW